MVTFQEKNHRSLSQPPHRPMGTGALALPLRGTVRNDEKRDQGKCGRKSVSRSSKKYLKNMPISDIIFALDDCFFRPETRWSAFGVGRPMLGGSVLSN